MRLRGRVDGNQAEIVEGLRKHGYSVLSLAPLGNGVPDLLVGFNNGNILLEVKAEEGKLTKDQVEFARTWNAPVWLVRDLDEALLRVRKARHG